jgi:hypothetical protein
MALVVPTAGELKMVLGYPTSQTLTCHLYSNTYQPVSSSVLSNFTECSFTGYSAQTLATSGWGTPSLDGSGDAVLQYGSAITWTAGASATVTGYYVCDSTNTVIWAEQFSVARSLSIGDELIITPQIYCKSAN